MATVLDVHVREFDGDEVEILRKLATVGSALDEFWITDLVQPMVLDHGTQPESRGGHGSVRYRVLEYDAGSFITFEFDPASGLVGTHRFIVTSGNGRVRLRHVLEADTLGVMRLLWRPVVLPIHSGVIEDVFDNLERSSTGSAHRQRPTSAMLRWFARRARRFY